MPSIVYTLCCSYSIATPNRERKQNCVTESLVTLFAFENKENLWEKWWEFIIIGIITFSRSHPRTKNHLGRYRIEKGGKEHLIFECIESNVLESFGQRKINSGHALWQVWIKSIVFPREAKTANSFGQIMVMLPAQSCFLRQVDCTRSGAGLRQRCSGVDWEEASEMTSLTMAVNSLAQSRSTEPARNRGGTCADSWSPSVACRSSSAADRCEPALFGIFGAIRCVVEESVILLSLRPVGHGPGCRMVLLTWSDGGTCSTRWSRAWTARFARECDACQDPGIAHCTHTGLSTNTQCTPSAAWCSEIGPPTSQDACNYVRGPISLHHDVLCNTKRLVYLLIKHFHIAARLQQTQHASLFFLQGTQREHWGASA